MSTYRRTRQRQEKIMALLAERSYLSVDALSRACGVSVVTIRRDLAALAEQGRATRTHGGSLSPEIQAEWDADRRAGEPPEVAGLPRMEPAALVDHFDVLITTVVDPVSDATLLEPFVSQGKPVIAESLPAPVKAPVVAIDNARAAREMGHWAGEYARRVWNGQARLLDLTYQLPNTQARSQGFWEGLQAELPGAERVLSVNAQSNAHSAYLLTRDALQVYPRINLIFAINDACAQGAARACAELQIDPAELLVIPFGLEGDTCRDLLRRNQYVKAGVAMFPEAVAVLLLDTAIRACRGVPLPDQVPTPYAILTADSLNDYYAPAGSGWQVRWDSMRKHFDLPEIVAPTSKASEAHKNPLRIGFTVRYRMHEWYRTLSGVLRSAAAQAGMELEIIDLSQTLKDELEQRRAEIARQAARLVRPDSFILLDSGPIAPFFARALALRQDLHGVRVMTNASDVLPLLQNQPHLLVICTGGGLRPDRTALVGPIPQTVLKEVDADQFFCMVGGIAADLDLTHDEMAEAEVKQAMLHAARQVILLADHTSFGQEAFVRFASLAEVDILVTDVALPASLRLELTRHGVAVMVAECVDR
jgi:DeoR family fructose operon transcriptional repressor